MKSKIFKLATVASLGGKNGNFPQKGNFSLNRSLRRHDWSKFATSSRWLDARSCILRFNWLKIFPKCLLHKLQQIANSLKVDVGLTNIISCKFYNQFCFLSSAQIKMFLFSEIYNKLPLYSDLSLLLVMLISTVSHSTSESCFNCLQQFQISNFSKL